MNPVRTIHSVAFRWMPPDPHNDVHAQDDESREARAERSLAHLEQLLQSRERWRHRLRVVALLAVPLLLTLFARQAARGAFA